MEGHGISDGALAVRRRAGGAHQWRPRARCRGASVLRGRRTRPRSCARGRQRTGQVSAGRRAAQGTEGRALLADDDPVEVAVLAVGQRRLGAGQDARAAGRARRAALEVSLGRRTRTAAAGSQAQARAHRTLAYCCSGWQMARRRPQSEMWSGTSGAPTAPKKMASNARRIASGSVSAPK